MSTKVLEQGTGILCKWLIWYGPIKMDRKLWWDEGDEIWLLWFYLWHRKCFHHLYVAGPPSPVDSKITGISVTCFWRILLSLEIRNNITAKYRQIDVKIIYLYLWDPDPLDRNLLTRSQRSKFLCLGDGDWVETGLVL